MKLAQQMMVQPRLSHRLTNKLVGEGKWPRSFMQDQDGMRVRVNTNLKVSSAEANLTLKEVLRLRRC